MPKPYAIYAPPYNELSAGIKALHLLQKYLSAAGYDVQIRTMGIEPQLPLPEDAIAIYPEIVRGNPLGAKHVVRWLLYYDRRYRPYSCIEPGDFVVGYTTRIAKASKSENVLFCPVVDENIFVPPEGKIERKGACFYAHKYQTFYQQPKPRWLDFGVEITNPGQSRSEIINLLQTCERLFVFEDTSLMVEAVLCGCLVHCMTNETWKDPCGWDDFNSGIAIDQADVVRAMRTLPEARKRYALLRDTFGTQLKKFIEMTQNK